MSWEMLVPLLWACLVGFVLGQTWEAWRNSKRHKKPASDPARLTWRVKPIIDDAALICLVQGEIFQIDRFGNVSRHHIQ